MGHLRDLAVCFEPLITPGSESRKKVIVRSLVDVRLCSGGGGQGVGPLGDVAVWSERLVTPILSPKPPLLTPTGGLVRK